MSRIRTTHSHRIDEDLSSLDGLVRFDVSEILPMRLDQECSLENKSLPVSPQVKRECINAEKATAAPSREVSKFDKPESDLIIDSKSRPPYSYSDLIELALRDQGNMAVRDIYKWITANFEYYKNLDETKWQPSVRHTLTISRRFYKVDRCRGGHLWGIVSEEDRKLASKKNHWKKQKIAEYQKTSLPRRAGFGSEEASPLRWHTSGCRCCSHVDPWDDYCRPWPSHWGCPMAHRQNAKGDTKSDSAPVWQCQRRPHPPPSAPGPYYWQHYPYGYSPYGMPYVGFPMPRGGPPFYWESANATDKEEPLEETDEDFGSWGLYPARCPKKVQSASRTPSQGSGASQEDSTADMVLHNENSSYQLVKKQRHKRGPSENCYVSKENQAPQDTSTSVSKRKNVQKRSNLTPSNLPALRKKPAATSQSKPLSTTKMERNAPSSGCLSSPHITSTTHTPHIIDIGLRNMLLPAQQSPFLSDVALPNGGLNLDGPEVMEALTEWPSHSTNISQDSGKVLDEAPLFASSADTLLTDLPGSQDDTESQPESPMPPDLKPLIVTTPAPFASPGNDLLFTTMPHASHSLPSQVNMNTPDTSVRDSTSVKEEGICSSYVLGEIPGSLESPPQSPCTPDVQQDIINTMALALYQASLMVPEKPNSHGVTQQYMGDNQAILLPGFSLVGGDGDNPQSSKDLSIGEDGYAQHADPTKKLRVLSSAGDALPGDKNWLENVKHEITQETATMQLDVSCNGLNPSSIRHSRRNIVLPHRYR